MPSSVSVVIPTYNHARYLPAAVQSVLAQTFSEWEAIIVDDGSTDDTPAVVSHYKDARVRYQYQENQGLSAARNTGIRAARGQYLAFLDADDEWEPPFLQRCIRVLAAEPTLAGVYTGKYLIDEQGAALPQLEPQSPGQVVARAAFRSRLLETAFFPPHAALVRADVVRQVGLFDTQLTSVEDWDLWLRISQNYQMQGIPDRLARYRVYSGSMSTNAARMHVNRMQVLAKYFGCPEGEPASWPDDKRRAYGFAYRRAAFSYLEQGESEEGWRFLTHALCVYPQLIRRLDTFYELACGDQPRGYRNQAPMLDLDRVSVELLGRLDTVFARPGLLIQPARHIAYSNAHLALAILNDQAGRWALARHHLWSAIRHNARLMASYPVVRRLLKLNLSWPFLSMARSSRETDSRL